eukprot:796507-Prymnesium_polylepis.1
MVVDDHPLVRRRARCVVGARRSATTTQPSRRRSPTRSTAARSSRRRPRRPWANCHGNVTAVGSTSRAAHRRAISASIRQSRTAGPPSPRARWTGASSPAARPAEA